MDIFEINPGHATWVLLNSNIFFVSYNYSFRTVSILSTYCLINTKNIIFFVNFITKGTKKLYTYEKA